MNKYITIKEASEILGITRLTLRNWDKSGKLLAHRHPFNNYRIYKIEDIDKVLEMIESNDFIVKKKKDEIRKLAVHHLEDDNTLDNNIINNE
jgi:excisionase family DNA binding protein